jgi:hypothetical protein
MSDTRWQHAIPTEWVLVETGEPDTFAASTAKVKVHDEGAGPFLGVEFINGEPTEYYSPHEAYFTTHDEIDRFAQHLHRALESAQPEAANLIEEQPA